MSDGKRSFWSSVPGLITGLAGLLTGIVGLITLLVQQGVIGRDSGSNVSAGNPGSTTVSSGVAGTGTSTVAGGTTATTEAASFTVSPATLDFAPADPKDKTLTVKNTSNTARLTVYSPTLMGQDQDRFSVSAGACTNAPLPANGTCTLKVTFNPQAGAALKKYSATLQVKVAETARVNEVALSASTLL